MTPIKRILQPALLVLFLVAIAVDLYFSGGRLRPVLSLRPIPNAVPLIVLSSAASENRSTSAINHKLAEVPAVTGGPTTAARPQLTLTDGSTMPVPKFILDTETTTTLGPSVFRDIAGGQQSSYWLSYLPHNRENSRISFNVVINAVPLATTRLEAEHALRTQLGVTNQQLCKMEVSVSVFRWVDERYSDRNLGLSFCNNAVPLR